MGKTAILHFGPLELYPPVQNFIRLLERNQAVFKIYVFTTTGTFNQLDLFKSGNKNVTIIRMGRSGQNIKPFNRIWNYLLFYMGCLFHLTIKRPKRILYFETISSFPAYLYRRFLNKKAELFIHYHEYTTPAEYENGMKLTKLFHGYEKWLYPRAKWISQTNEYRLQMFMKDNEPIAISNPQIFANYPPKAWFKEPSPVRSYPLKIIYIGSLSMDTMYTREFSEWVLAQNGKVIWHIYSYNITKNAIKFLQTLNSEFIVLKEGVNYNEMPGILKLYDVGIVLYNGHILNYIFNAPNKLFEYLTCGLDVWYPEVMQGCYKYDSTETWPKVLRLDFKALHKYDIHNLIEREKNKSRFVNFHCEDEADVLVKNITK